MRRLRCFVLGHLWHVSRIYPSAWYAEKAYALVVCRRCGKEEVSHG
jgi:hypothetical protein